MGQLCERFHREVLTVRQKRPEIALDVLDRDVKPTIGDVPLSQVTPDIASRPVQAAVARDAKGTQSGCSKWSSRCSVGPR